MEPALDALARFVAETPAAVPAPAVRAHAARIVAKFLALAAPVLGARGAAAAWTLGEGVEGLKDSRELGDGLRALAGGG